MILTTKPLMHVMASHPGFLLSLLEGAKDLFVNNWNAKTADLLAKQEHVTQYIGALMQSVIFRLKEYYNLLKMLNSVVSSGVERPSAQVQKLKVFPHGFCARTLGKS